MECYVTIFGDLDWPLSGSPCISSQAVILTKFRLTKFTGKFQQQYPSRSYKTVFPAWERAYPRKTALFGGLGRPHCRNGWPGNGVPMRSTHFNPCVHRIFTQLMASQYSNNNYFFSFNLLNRFHATYLVHGSVEGWQEAWRPSPLRCTQDPLVFKDGRPQEDLPVVHCFCFGSSWDKQLRGTWISVCLDVLYPSFLLSVFVLGEPHHSSFFWQLISLLGYLIALSNIKSWLFVCLSVCLLVCCR